MPKGASFIYRTLLRLLPRISAVALMLVGLTPSHAHGAIRPSVTDRIGRIRTAIALQASQENSSRGQASGDNKLVQWGNWGNWGNWRNWSNWSNWANWGNWGNL